MIFGKKAWEDEFWSNIFVFENRMDIIKQSIALPKNYEDDQDVSDAVN